MKQYYLNFIRSGDPNGDGLKKWDAVSGSLRVMEFGDCYYSVDDSGWPCMMRNDPYAELHRILDEMYGVK